MFNFATVNTSMLQIITSEIIFYSLTLQVFTSNSFWGYNTWIAGFKLFRLNEGILACANKLSLIICTSVTNDDLRWVLIWHHDGGLWKPASETVRVVGLKGLLQHTSVKILTNFELILGESSYFTQSLCIKVNWFWRSIVECQANCLSVLLQDFTTWCYFSIFEHSGWVVHLVLMNWCFEVKSLLISVCFCRLIS